MSFCTCCFHFQGPYPVKNVSSKQYKLTTGLSQIHKRANVGRDIWRSPGPNPCSRRATESRCPGWCPKSFSVSPKVGISQCPWETCNPCSFLSKAKFFSFLIWFFCKLSSTIWVNAHWYNVPSLLICAVKISLILSLKKLYDLLTN